MDGHYGDLAGDEAGAEVAGLYRAHAVGLIRLAVIMLGDRAAAEDAVQEAFYGLHRRWNRLSDADKALSYVRVAVLNRCRSELRARARRERHRELADAGIAAGSPESEVLVGEEHRAVLAALRRLPGRQREVLVLRFYLELSEPQIADAMSISRGTVKSTTSRALVALGRELGEEA